MASNEDTSVGLGHSTAQENAMLVFECIAMYNVIELTFIICIKFKRRSGCYFWSFIVATYGIAFHVAGLLIENEAPGVNPWVATPFISIGWNCMVTGQAMVLWSRLHLILRNKFRLNLVLAMIIADLLFCGIPTTVFTWLVDGGQVHRLASTAEIIDKFQVTLFFTQEVIISAVYIWETIKLIKMNSRRHAKGPQKLLRHLLAINVIVVLLDVVIIGLQFAGYYHLQRSYKAFAYSAKLKLEFTILNKLAEITQAGGWREGGQAEQHQKEIADAKMDAFSIYGSRPGPGHSYEAHAEADGWDAEAAEPRKPRGQSVMLTTEITVKSQNKAEVEPEFSMDTSATGMETSGTVTASLHDKSSKISWEPQEPAPSLPP